MGNSISFESQTFKQVWIQHHQLVKSPGCPKLLISVDNAYFHAEKYKFLVEKDLSQKEECILNKRLQPHRNLVRVYNYQVAANVLGCSSQNLVSVITQRIPFRLSDICKIKITFEQMLFILREAIKGYQMLHKLGICSVFNANMIGVNNAGQVKVWINQNFGKSSNLGSQKMSEESNVDNIFKTIMESTQVIQNQKYLKVELVYRINRSKLTFNRIQQIINGQRIDQIICKERLVKRLNSQIQNKISHVYAVKKRAVSEQLIKSKDKVVIQNRFQDSQFYKPFQRKNQKSYSDIMRKSTPRNTVLNDNRVNNMMFFSPRANKQLLKPVKCYFNYCKQPTLVDSFSNRNSTDCDQKQNSLSTNMTAKNIQNVRKRCEPSNLNKDYRFQIPKKQAENKRLLTVIENSLAHNQQLSKINILSNCQPKNYKGSVRIQTEILAHNFRHQKKKSSSEDNSFANSHNQTPLSRKQIQKRIHFPLSQTNKDRIKSSNKQKQFLETIFKKSNSKIKKQHPLSIISQSSMNLNFQLINYLKQDKNIQTQEIVLQLMKQQSKRVLKTSGAVSQQIEAQKADYNQQSTVQNKQSELQKGNESEVSVQEGKIFLDLFKYYLGANHKETKKMDQEDTKLCNTLFSENNSEYQELDCIQTSNNEASNGNQKQYQEDSYSGLQTIQQETQNEQSIAAGSYSARASANISEAKSC